MWAARVLAAVRDAQQHGVSIFYRGASARIALLLIVNGLNDLPLKKAWEGIEDPNVTVY